MEIVCQDASQVQTKGKASRFPRLMLLTIAFVLLVGIAISMNAVIFENYSVSLATVTRRVAPISNIGYLSNGYNVFRGNPLADSVDPGFTGSSIFSLSYTSKSQTADKKYLVPDGTDMFSVNDCSLAFTSSTVTGETTLTNNFKQDVSFSVEGYGAAFKASVSYKEMSTSTTSNKFVYVTSTAKCSVYNVKFQTYDMPNLSTNFIKGYKTLKTDLAAYYKFIDTFGTHYVNNIKMGAKYGYISKLTQESYSQLQSSSVDVAVAASLTYYGLTFGVGSQTGVEKSKSEKFSSATKEKKQFSIGSKVPAKAGSANAWAQQVFSDPMPIQYSLVSLDQLLEEFYPKSTQAKNMKKALANYCKYYLLKNKLIPNCDSPNADPTIAPYKPPVVVKAQSCRLCQSCGGKFTLQQGRTLTEGDYGPWQQFGQQCSGDYPFSSNNPLPSLCCTPENPPCAYCTTCGGNWPRKTGRKVNRGDWGPYDIKSNQCQGDIKRTHDEFDLCCKATQECQWCDNGCSGKYNVVGQVERKDDYGDWEVNSLSQCYQGGSYSPVTIRGGAAFCCLPIT